MIRIVSAAAVALFIFSVGMATTISAGGDARPSVALGPGAAGVEQPLNSAGTGPAVDSAVGGVSAPPPPAQGAGPSPPGPSVDVAIAPAPDRFEAPPSPPLPPPPALVQPLALNAPQPGTAPGTWAVIIGINDYPGSRSDLRSAVNDADDMELALAAMGVPAEQLLVLRDGQATADRIREATAWLVSRAGPDAAAVFFYAGHVRKVGATSESLLAADGGLVGDKELAARLADLAARRAWVVIAGCYGGGFTEVLGPGRILTGAAPADALAWENPAFGRSYLVQYMVREAMIERRAPESVQAAFAYASAALAREYPDRQPVQTDQTGSPLDLRPAPVASALPPLPPVTPTVPVPITAPCRQLLILACRT